jgi:hypothetical protein
MYSPLPENNNLVLELLFIIFRSLVFIQSSTTSSFQYTEKPSSTEPEHPIHFFRSCDFCYCNLLGETYNAALIQLFLPSLVSKVPKTPSPGLESWEFFRVCCLHSEITSPINQSWSYVCSYTIISFQGTETSHRDWNPGQFFGVVAFVPVIF